MAEIRYGIDPGALYCVEDAARLLPSRRPGKRMHPATLRRYLAAGKIACVRRPTPDLVPGRGKRLWTKFVPGSEILRLYESGPAPSAPLSPEERRRKRRATKRGLGRFGLEPSKLE